ncbi:hypothetical protein C8A05DRAFT_46067 [Staphylotrichum tortipilum]|uniref:Uncharacterized protein n=1 Tax=Staphylotrichum tortipilum TaxID=2831512 RepID=A0AAN6MG85_9PEZI|nr:hypothetical protein C8A05DRAFT_46067 [Staphylotrichum longicolle]
MSSHGIPEVLMQKVDEYVDSLAPQIQPRIAQELDVFQKKTIDSLENQVVDAFRSLFDKDKNDHGNSRGLDDRVPDAYGGQSLPFADEITSLTRSFTNIAGDAGDDLRAIFDITDNSNTQGDTRSRSSDHGSGGGRTDNFKGFLSAAVSAVQDHLDDNRGSGGGGGGQGFQLDGLLGALSNTVRDAARNPEEKARMISPEIKEKVGIKLGQLHGPIAEQFTRIALDHIKRWLRGNTSSRDLGDGVKGEIEDQVKDLVKGLGGLFRHKEQSSGQGTSRGFGDQDRDEAGGGREGGGGFSKVISEKLSTGLARVHREVRLEFRKVLGGIEKQLFELLPDEFQRPLEKILGGNPFDPSLDREAGGGPQADRGLGSDIKAKLVDKIRGLVRKVQEALRGGILGVVNGGHRKFERESWVFVQNMVEVKVQKYLPKVKISVPDDIGNEGVSVGAPTSNIQLGGGHQPIPSHTGSGQGSSGGGHQQSSYNSGPGQANTGGGLQQAPYFPGPPGQVHDQQQQPSSYGGPGQGAYTGGGEQQAPSHGGQGQGYSGSGQQQQAPYGGSGQAYSGGGHQQAPYHGGQAQSNAPQGGGEWENAPYQQGYQGGGGHQGGHQGSHQGGYQSGHQGGYQRSSQC